MKKPGGVLLNMKLSYKLCLIYTVLLLCVLLTVNGVHQYLYARDMRATTTALFEQICMSFESVMN